MDIAVVISLLIITIFLYFAQRGIVTYKLYGKNKYYRRHEAGLKFYVKLFLLNHWKSKSNVNPLLIIFNGLVFIVNFVVILVGIVTVLAGIEVEVLKDIAIFLVIGEAISAGLIYCV